MYLIKVSKLKKYFGDRLLLDIDNLEINENEKIGLVGANGEGKSTLLNIICGQEFFDEGKIYLDGSHSYIKQMEEDESSLSGGEKVKARISKALDENSKLIIADEPTSNLDVNSISFVESKFKEFNGSILLVSHDRIFLDNIVNKIFEIQDGKLTVYNGNYSSYLIQKEERINRKEFQYREYISEKQRLEEAILKKCSLKDGIKKAPKRFGNSEARLHKMGDQSAKKSLDNSIKNIRSRIDKLDAKEKPKEELTIKLDIREGQEFYSNYPVEFKNINIVFGNKVLLEDASFKLKRNSKVAVIGDNGCGKTTLIKKIMNIDEGIRVANRVKIGYFEQDLRLLEPHKSIIENMKTDSTLNETLIRTVLARFLFKGDSIYKKIEVLSGGEQVKASICKVILSDNNVLILDEPTNYLDINSIKALEDALQNSNKTMLLVSHDRSFLANVCNEVLNFIGKELNHYPYPYEEWLNSIKEPKLSKTEREKKDIMMIMKNRIAEVISLISTETDKAKLEEYEKRYEQLIKECSKI